jgi:hypothetical protein
MRGIVGCSFALTVLKKFSLVRAGKTKYEPDLGGWG